MLGNSQLAAYNSLFLQFFNSFSVELDLFMVFSLLKLFVQRALRTETATTLIQTVSNLRSNLNCLNVLVKKTNGIIAVSEILIDQVIFFDF